MRYVPLFWRNYVAWALLILNKAEEIMAAEEDLKLEGGEEEAPAGGGKKKLIIIALLCLLVGVGIGAGVFFVLGGGSSD